MSEISAPNSTAWICETCGLQHAPSIEPPNECKVCNDERQYIGWNGQQWTTRDDLESGHRVAFTVEDGVTTMHVEPSFAIGQRAFLIPHSKGLVMWECLSLVTPDAVARIKVMGKVTALAISHPHFYSAMVDWSDALGGVPIYLHANDADWPRRSSRHIRYWQGERLKLADDIELVLLGGHFAGSTGLWWKSGPRLGGSLFPGDAVQVVMDRQRATFMYSYPNMIPLGPAALGALERRVAPLEFEDVFGFSPGRQMIGDAKFKIEQSFSRIRNAMAN